MARLDVHPMPGKGWGGYVLANIPGHELKRAMASLMEHHDRVIHGLDTSLLGF